MNWRAYAIRFGAFQGLRWWLRSERTTTERKMMVLGIGAPLMAGVVVAIEVVWNLTGRARRLRHALGQDEIQIMPGGDALSPEFRARADALAAEGRGEYERMKAELEQMKAEIERKRAEGAP